MSSSGTLNLNKNKGLRVNADSWDVPWIDSTDFADKKVTKTTIHTSRLSSSGNFETNQITASGNQLWMKSDITASDSIVFNSKADASDHNSVLIGAFAGTANTIFNYGGEDVDFRILGNSQNPTSGRQPFFVDGTNHSVGMGIINSSYTMTGSRLIIHGSGSSINALKTDGDINIDGNITSSGHIRLSELKQIEWGTSTLIGHSNWIGNYVGGNRVLSMKTDSVGVKGYLSASSYIASNYSGTTPYFTTNNSNFTFRNASIPQLLFASSSGNVGIGVYNANDMYQAQLKNRTLTVAGDMYFQTSSAGRNSILAHNDILRISSSVSMSGDLLFSPGHHNSGSAQDVTIGVKNRTGGTYHGGRNLVLSASNAFDNIGGNNQQGGDIILQPGQQTGTGRQGQVRVLNSGTELYVAGNISSSGDLWVSSSIYAGQNIGLASNSKLYFHDSDTYIRGTATAIWLDGDDRITFEADDSVQFKVPSDKNIGITGSLQGDGDILKVNGTISASANIDLGVNISSPTLTIRNIDNSSGWSLTTKGGIHSYYNPQSLSNTFFGVGTATPTSMLTVSGGLDVSGSTNINELTASNITTPGTITAGDNASDSHIFSGSLTVSGDIAALPNGKGLILKSPDGTRYRIKVANGGALSTEAV